MDSGSPPCSPQNPSFRPGLVRRPSCAAISTSRPTPSPSMVSNGETVKTPFSRYAAKTDDSTSSREKPQVVWVRSLVPKEKKSASSAIRCAVSAARGSSIMVPIGTPRARSRVAATFELGAHRLGHGPDLQGEQAGDEQAESDPPEAEHGIRLVEPFHGGQ